jgi:hypothetical protein
LDRAWESWRLGPEGAPLLESLCRALLIYLYTVPAIAGCQQTLGQSVNPIILVGMRFQIIAVVLKSGC